MVGENEDSQFMEYDNPNLIYRREKPKNQSSTNCFFEAAQVGYTQ
jgi:hypothetical protein